VERLRQRLQASGDLAADTTADAEEAFGPVLEQAVKQFQTRHGLESDGIVGAATRDALNVPVEMRIQQLRLNMERWRWLPQNLGARYIVVNIAGFELRVMEQGQEVMQMRVVTGQPYRQTPVFSDEISYLVLNPYWHVPHSIAVKDKLPLIKQNPNYLAQQNMTLFRGWGADAKVVNPATVDWSTVTASNFPLSAAPRSRAAECTRARQVHVSQQVQCVPPRHAEPLALCPGCPQLQFRVHPAGASDGPHPLSAGRPAEVDGSAYPTGAEYQCRALGHTQTDNAGSSPVLDGVGRPGRYDPLPK
jgi:hypothetical protein